MKSLLVISPHADDETLGCGGTILKMKDKGMRIGWVIITDPSIDSGYSVDFIERRDREISMVAECYGFSSVTRLKISPGEIVDVPRGILIGSIADAITDFNPHTIFLPSGDDVHSDHRIVFEASQSVLKTFRRPSVERILCYETISESDQTFESPFAPNVFINIDGYLERKIDIMKMFSSEIFDFPFPRSACAIKSLAHFRGAQAGFLAAESFRLMRERIF